VTKNGLTEQRKIFCDEYLIDFNGTRAYKVAYPSIKNDDAAAVSASRLLRNVKIEEYIQKRMKDRERRTEVTQDKVIAELAAIAFASASDYAKVVSMKHKDGSKFASVALTVTDDLSREQKKAISQIKTTQSGIEVKTHDKVKALELLGKHLGIFIDNVNLSGEVSAPVMFVFGDDEKSEDEK